MKLRLTTLTLLALGTTALGQAPSFPTYVAETYGGVSGDTPLPGLGLVLELVGGDTPEPSLRLFGGPAGQEAAIVVSIDEADYAGARGARHLVEPGGITFHGSFDWRGYYEVPLTAGAAGTSFFAQGVHVGMLDLAPGGGPLVQYSNGLHVAPKVEDSEPIGFDDFLPHLPELSLPLPVTAPLAERLQLYLNSPGDSTKIKLEVEGSLGTGANGGVAIEAEFLIQRTAEGYEVKIGTDVAAKAGVEAVEGVEANVYAGVGGTRVFRFHSAPGAARGIFGIMMSLRFPELAPGKWIAESGLIGDADDFVQAIQVSIELAEQIRAEAERLLWDVLDQVVVNSRSQRDGAWSFLKQAVNALASAKWYARPFWASQVALRSGIYVAAEAKYQAARLAREEGEKALAHAEWIVEQHREQLRTVFRGAAQVARIGSAVLQLRGYATDHYVGLELRQKIKGDAKVGIPLPVKLEGLEASASAEVEILISALFEGTWGDESSRITVTRQLETKGTLDGSLAGLGGGKYENKKTGAVVETFEFGDGTFSKSMGVSLARDNYVAAKAAAVGVSASVGLGRASSISLNQQQFTIDEGFDLGAFLTGAGRDVLADTSIGFSLQDRRVQAIECEVKGSVAGNGGGFKLLIEWADQGRQLSRSTTLREAVDTIFDGVDQVLDPETGLVATP